MDTEGGNAMEGLGLKIMKWFNFCFAHPIKPCKRVYRYACCSWAKSEENG